MSTHIEQIPHFYFILFHFHCSLSLSFWGHRRNSATKFENINESMAAVSGEFSDIDKNKPWSDNGMVNGTVIAVNFVYKSLSHIFFFLSFFLFYNWVRNIFTVFSLSFYFISFAHWDCDATLFRPKVAGKQKIKKKKSKEKMCSKR